MAERCTEMEDSATKVERKVNKMLIAEVMRSEIGSVFKYSFITPLTPNPHVAISEAQCAACAPTSTRCGPA